MIEFDSLRKDIDPPFLALVESLDVAYYQFWKKGLPQLWHGFDVQATPALSKALFDRLHGAIWNAHELAIRDENEKRGFPYPVDKVDPLDETGAVRRSRQTEARLRVARAAGIDVATILAARGMTIGLD